MTASVKILALEVLEMPHVVIAGGPELAEVFRRLEAISVREGSTVLKTGAMYLERGGTAIIVEATAIESGKPLSFLVLIGRRDDGLVVRLHPVLDVEKTGGLKKLLALIAHNIIANNPGSSLGKTNLGEFLLPETAHGLD